MRALRPREKHMLALTLAVVGSALLYIESIEPRWRRAAELHSQLEFAEKELEEARSLVEHREAIQSRSADLQKQIASSGAESDEVKSLLEEVERLAAGASLTTQSLRPQKSRDLGLYRMLSVELTAEGSPQHLARFLHAMRGSKQLLRVDRVQVDAMREAGRVKTEMLITKILSAGAKDT